MFKSNPHPNWRYQRPSPAAQALALSAGGMAALLVAGGLLLHTPWVPVVVFGLVALGVSHAFANRYPHARIGLCNTVTLFRAALVAFLFGAMLEPAFSAWLFFVVATTAFALDGVDGWLARRSGLASDFGARFDMEVDAALAAVLALWLLLTGVTGPQILVLGFTRYAFVAAALVLPALRRDLPASFRRKAVCVVQIAVLLILLMPLTPAMLVGPLATLAAILLLGSFAIDVRWLLRRAA